MIPIDDLINEIKIASGINAIFGQHDFAPDEYPIINILPDGGMDIQVINTHASNLEINLTIKIITARDCERQALEVLDKLLKQINKIDCQKGNRVGKRSDNIITGTIETVYTDNTYEISIPYQIQEIIQDTQ